MNEFLSKVRAERRVLKSINDRCGDPALCGLSNAAIERWIIDNKLSSSLAVPELKSLAADIGSLSDRSGERFDEAHQKKGKEIESRLTVFEVSLSTPSLKS